MFWNKMRKLEKGQAFAEYGILLPVGVMVGIVAAGALGVILQGTYGDIVDAVEIEKVVNCEAPTTEEVEGPTEANMGSHNITLTSHVYNPETNTTTVSYTVTSGGDPSISHWVLGMSDDVDIVDMPASELPSWVENDPSAPNGEGISGLKFDAGYESEGGEGGGNTGNTNNGGGNGKGGKKSIMMTGMRDMLLAPTFGEELITDSRTITLHLMGQYDFYDSEVAIKAGQEYYTGTIAAPVRKVTIVETETLGYGESCE